MDRKSLGGRLEEKTTVVFFREKASRKNPGTELMRPPEVGPAQTWMSTLMVGAQVPHLLSPQYLIASDKQWRDRERQETEGYRETDMEKICQRCQEKIWARESRIDGSRRPKWNRNRAMSLPSALSPHSTQPLPPHPFWPTPLTSPYLWAAIQALAPPQYFPSQDVRCKPEPRSTCPAYWGGCSLGRKESESGHSPPSTT